LADVSGGALHPQHVGQEVRGVEVGLPPQEEVLWPEVTELPEREVGLAHYEEAAVCVGDRLDDNEH